MSGTVPQKATEKELTKVQPDPIVVDLGRQKRKAVKKLRRGDGKLMDKAMDTVDELRRVGTISESAQPVIIVVREKSRTDRMFPLLGR